MLTPQRLTSRSRKLLLTSLLAGILLAGTTASAGNFPKPSPYPISWELKFEHATPKRIAVKAPGDPAPRAYWYMTFTVTNETTSEQQFLPVFEMLCKDGTVIKSDQNIHQAVFDTIKRVERKKMLEPLAKVTGRLLIGPDQARDSVAIWPEPEPRMGTFSIFIAGLSGETTVVKNGEPLFKPGEEHDWSKFTPEDRKSFVTLQKTLQLTYQIAGDEIYPGEDKVNFVSEEWIMR